VVKIKQVAERAGVSPTSVSHVLSRKRQVSDELRRKVEAAIADLGYAPNPLAAGLRTGRTGSVAFVLPDICNPNYSEMARALQAGLTRSGEDMLVYNSDLPGQSDAMAADETGRAILDRIRAGRVDGLIVAEAALQGAERELRTLGCPCIYIGDLPEPLVDSVSTDQAENTRIVAGRLIELGHTRIAHVTGPHHLRMSKPRKDAFESALTDAGCPIIDELRFEGSFLAESGRRAADWLVDQMPRHQPTAIFVAGSQMARGMMGRLYDLGVSVPGDIAVATYDMHNTLEDLRPRLTSVGTEPSQLAERALEMLRERLSGKETGPPRREVIPGRLRVGQTT
jgi:DNA-binding LacI/PurR family transcriptional regulator